MVIKKAFQDFYIQKFLQIRDSFKRNKYLSFALVLFQTLQIQGIYISGSIFESDELGKKRGIMDAVIMILKSAKVFPLFQSSTSINKIIFIDFSFIILLIVFSFIGLLAILTTRSQKYMKNHKVNGLYQLVFTDSATQLQTQQNLLMKFIKFITYVVSVFLQTYKYLFHWSIIYCALDNIYIFIKNPSENNDWMHTLGITTSVIVLLFFVLFDNFMMFHFFDYKFKNPDFLGQKESNLELLLNQYIYSTIAIVVFTQQEYPNLQLLLGLLFTIYQLFLSSFLFLNRKQMINYIKSLILGQFIFLYIAQFCFVNGTFSIEFINLIVFIASPIIIKIQNKIQELQVKQYLQLDDKHFRFFESKLRKIFDLIKITYQKEWRAFRQPVIRAYVSLQLHSLAANHLRNCYGNQSDFNYQNNAVKKCFCKQYFQYNEEKSVNFWKRELDAETENKYFAFKSEKQFKQFLFDLIKDSFERYLTQKSILETNVQFSYIYFLFQIQKKPTKAFYEAMNLKFKIKKLSQKKIMIIEQLIQDAKFNFNLMIEKKDLKNQKYNFKQVFDYDQNLDTTKLNFQIILTNYKKWYNQLLNQQLQLQMIIKKGIELQQQIQQLEQQIFSLYQLNPVSSELDTIVYLFYKYIHFNLKRPKSIRRNSSYANQFIQSINQQVFEKESCIIYISLMNQRGSIQNYTKSFKSLILGNDQDIKNQNIKHFMPDSIAQYHDMYLDNFIELGRMNIVMAEQRFLILKNKQQFIIPVYAKVRLENYSNSDFGSSALITQINQQNYYIVISRYGILEEMSQNFYQEIIQKTLNYYPYQLKNLNLLRLMPCLLKDLQKLEVNQQNSNEIDFEFSQQNKDQINYDILMEGHILIPKQQTLLDQLQISNKNILNVDVENYFFVQQQKNHLFYQNVQHLFIFYVKYKIRLMKTINSLHRILEIQTLKMIKSEHQQKAIRIVQNICNIEQSSILKFQQAPKIHYYLQDSDGYDAFQKEQIEAFRKSQSSELFDRKSYDLENNLIMEEDNMISQKQRNFDEHYSTRRDLIQQTLLNTLDSHVYQKTKENVQLLQNESDTTKQLMRKNSFNVVSKGQIDDMELSNKQSKDSIDQDSGSNYKNRQATIHQKDGSSIASSQQQNDYISKRRMIRDVLFSDHQFQNTATKTSILIFGLVLLIILYLVNLIFIVITQHKVEEIEANKHVSINIQNSLNLFILSNQFEQIQIYQNNTWIWYQQLQNLSIINYQIYLRQILNAQNSIIEQSMFNQLKTIYFEETIKYELDQLFIIKLIGEYMIDYNSDKETHKDGITFLIRNFQVIVQEMLVEFNNTTYSNIQQEIDIIDSQIQLTIILSEVTLSLIVIILLPVFLIINRQKNTILEFFMTFPQNELQQQYDIYQILLDKLEETKFAQQETNQYDIESSHIKQFVKSIRLVKDSNQSKQQYGKLKKMIGSNATPLIIFSIFLVLLLFSIVSAYFITSFMIKYQFLSDYKRINNDIKIYDSLQCEILKENAIQNLILNQILNQNVSDVIKNTVLELFEVEKASQYPTILYYQQELTQRFSDSSNEEFYNVLSNNTCDIFNSDIIKHLELEEFLDFYSYQGCQTIGQVQQGISISIINFVNQLKQLYSTLQFFENNNGYEYKTLYDSIIFLKDQDIQQSYLYTAFALQVITNYQDQQIKTLVQQHYLTQIIAFVVGASFISVFTLITEKCFKSLISNQINQSKLLLTLIPFETLQTNAYVMTYVLQESKKIYL
ncbi:unnamed protein product [Paramecium octaurelia]|uniref:Transmembrane protein n=1 Tax=Paramecium octaurelia TaxID=43137 RepID=A0A8S1UY58_PAROT|nr:unnamed protein product [Paramecium octaurelia]